MKLSEYVIAYLADVLKIGYVFTISGGANMHLLDALAKNPNIKYICPQHEQGGAMAAEAYAKAGMGLGAMIVTSGPGGINAISGCAGSWFESTPCIFISGQVNLKQFVDGKTVRQLGVQQANIVEIVRPITKYAVLVDDPLKIRFHLEKAAYLARSGRPGPVWLDIPTDVQQAQVEHENMEGFVVSDSTARAADEVLKTSVAEAVALMREAKRPVLLAGWGIRLAHAESEFMKLVNVLSWPVVTTWNGIDLIESDHSFWIGRSGFYGQRAGNFAMANADLILSIGSRLDTKQVGNNSKAFARAAKKIVVDIDRYELQKGLIDVDLPLEFDAKDFIKEVLLQLGSRFAAKDIRGWMEKCREWKEKYPVVLPAYREEKNAVNSFVFVDTLCDHLTNNDVIVTDMGTSLTCTMQAFRVKKGQRLFSDTGFASMGFGLPAAIGAWFAGENKNGRVVCISGDGGLQMNVQELQTVVHYKIPIKLFVLNNGGYLTIRHTQAGYMGGRLVASGPESGVSVPSFVKIGQAYGLQTETIRNHGELASKIKKVLGTDDPVLCEIFMAGNQPLVPKLVGYSGKDGFYIDDPIEKMWPYLPDDEFLSNMIVEPLMSDGQ